MTSLNEFIMNFLVNSVWQVPIVCGLAALGTYLLRNSSARYRHSVWVVTLLFCLIAPFVTAMQVVPALPLRSISTDDGALVTPTNNADEELAPDHTRRRKSQVVVEATPRNMQVVALAYCLFLGLCGVRFARLWRSKENLRRSVSFEVLPAPIELAMRRCMALFGIEGIRIGRSTTARVPCTLGITRPLIVLPESFCGDVDQETLLSVIGHEMAHVRRKDFLTKLLCELVSLPISFHPLTFLIKRQIERERELACDDLVTQQILQPETYARSLLRAADLSIIPARRSMMLSVFDGRMLEQRIRRLTHQRFSLNKWFGRVITAAVLGVLCLSSLLGSAFGVALRGPLELSVPVAIATTPVTTALPQGPATDRTPKQDRTTAANRSQSSTPQELAQAACDAGRKRDVEAIPSLVAMLGDDREVAPIACYTTGNWSPALDTFKRPSPGEQAALALASMGRNALAPLTEQLDNSNVAARRNAAWAIGELTNMVTGERAAAIPQLITLLRDVDPWVRMAAARAIGEVRDRRASDTLIATLSDADWRVRRLAAWALNEMKEELAVPALCNLLLGDSRAEVRTAAAEALGEIRSAKALPSLQQALNDAEAGVRAKASWAIAEIN